MNWNHFLSLTKKKFIPFNHIFYCFSGKSQKLWLRRSVAEYQKWNALFAKDSLDVSRGVMPTSNRTAEPGSEPVDASKGLSFTQWKQKELRDHHDRGHETPRLGQTSGILSWHILTLRSYPQVLWTCFYVHFPKHVHQRVRKGLFSSACQKEVEQSRVVLLWRAPVLLAGVAESLCHKDALWFKSKPAPKFKFHNVIIHSNLLKESTPGPTASNSSPCSETLWAENKHSLHSKCHKSVVQV